MDLQAECDKQIAFLQSTVIQFKTELSDQESELVRLALGCGFRCGLAWANKVAREMPDGVELIREVEQSQTIACKHRVDQAMAKDLECK